jgi:hypothetical protein
MFLRFLVLHSISRALNVDKPAATREKVAACAPIQTRRVDEKTVFPAVPD